MNYSMTRTIAAISLVAVFGFAQDSIKLARTYKTDETGTLALQVDVDAQGQQIKASAKVSYKVSKLLDGGKAKATLTVKDPKVDMGGQEMPVDLSPLEVTLDSWGMSDTLPTHEAEWLFTLSSLASIVPGKDLKPGESFDLNWTNDSKVSTLKGKGKFLEVVDLDGIKSAKVEYDVSFSPQATETPGQMKSTGWFDIRDGRLIKSEGKIIANDGMEMKFTAKSEKS